MRCPYCETVLANTDKTVKDTRHTLTEIRRRRECSVCRKRFTTVERIDVQSIDEDLIHLCHA